MSAALRKLHACRREYKVPEDIFRAILMGQIGRATSKGITMGSVNACVEKFKEHNPAAAASAANKKKDWRPTAKCAHVRKIYALWGVLKRNNIVDARYPDGFVKRQTDMDRAEFLPAAETNIVIEGLIAWIKREGLGNELNR